MPKRTTKPPILLETANPQEVGEQVEIIEIETIESPAANITAAELDRLKAKIKELEAENRAKTSAYDDLRDFAISWKRKAESAEEKVTTLEQLLKHFNKSMIETQKAIGIDIRKFTAMESKLKLAGEIFDLIVNFDAEKIAKNMDVAIFHYTEAGNLFKKAYGFDMDLEMLSPDSKTELRLLSSPTNPK